MSDFNEIFEELKKGIVSLAENNLKEFKDQAISSGMDFLEQSKDEIKLWTEELATGQMSKEDFEWLVKGKKDLAELIILKEKGLAKSQVDKFTNGVCDVLISTAFRNLL